MKPHAPWSIPSTSSAAVPDMSRDVFMMDAYRNLSTSKKAIVTVFLIWLVQAVPKWSAAIFAGGETSSAIMQMFIEPRR
ncbi:MAG: hypothetical protein ACWA5X_10460 [bacterium]